MHEFIGDWIIPFAANAAAAAKIDNAFEWPEQPAEIDAPLWGLHPIL